MKKLFVILSAIPAALPTAMERSFTPKTNYYLARLVQVVVWLILGTALLLLMSLESLSITWVDTLVRGGIAVALIGLFLALFEPTEEVVARFRSQLRGHMAR